MQFADQLRCDLSQGSSNEGSDNQFNFSCRPTFLLLSLSRASFTISNIYLVPCAFWFGDDARMECEARQVKKRENKLFHDNFLSFFFLVCVLHWHSFAFINSPPSPLVRVVRRRRRLLLGWRPERGKKPRVHTNSPSSSSSPCAFTFTSIDKYFSSSSVAL